ncbi:MAG: TIM44-like domain-containing protein [Clostridia bacterium]|nr:TIM44-like domain-containing protein [Clostridia bacterium]
MSFEWLTPYHVMVEGGDSGLQPMSELCKYDPSFSVPDMQARVSNLTVQLLFGFGDGDMAPLKPYVTEELLQEFQRQAAEFAEQGRKLNVVRPAILRTEMLGFELGKGEARVHVRTQTRAVLYVTDRNGNVVDGNSTSETFESRTWVFVRGIDEKTGRVLRIDSQHCPNCGAPVNVYMSARCSHCGTLVPVAHFKWTACAVY